MGSYSQVIPKSYLDDIVYFCPPWFNLQIVSVDNVLLQAPTFCNFSIVDLWFEQISLAFSFQYVGALPMHKLACINNLLRLSSQMLSSSQGTNITLTTKTLGFCSSYCMRLTTLGVEPFLE